MVSASRRKRTPTASLAMRKRSGLFVVLCLSTNCSRQSSEAFLVPSYTGNILPAPSSVRFYNAPLSPLQNSEPSRESWRDALYSPSPKPSNSSNLDVFQYMQDIPSMDDLYQSLDVLEHGLEEKSDQYRQLVHNLQVESEQAVDNIQQWETLYQTKIDQLESQAASAEQNLQAQERELYTMLTQLRQESANKKKTAAGKIQRLAEQLQTSKLVAHKQHLQTEHAAYTKQQELQSKIEKLQADLQSQIQLTESEKAKQGDSWQKRMALEVEVATTTKALKQTNHDLEQRVGAEQEQRHLEHRRYQDQLAKHESQLREKLREVREQFAADTSSLEIRLEGREMHQSLVTLKGEFQRIGVGLHESLKRISSELQQLRFESHAKLEAEKREFAQREAALRSEIDRKEAQIRKKTEMAAVQSSKVESLWQKRMELEQEVSKLRHNYVTALAEWEARVQSARESGENEILAKDELLIKQETLARAKMEAAEEELESHKEALNRGLQAKDSEHRSAMQQLRSSLFSKINDLTDRLKKKSDELQENRFASHRILMAQKDASVVEQTRLLSVLRQKEKELADQTALTAAASEQVSAHWASRMELEKVLSTMKYDYDRALGGWENRFAALEDARVKELRLLAQRESEAEEMIRAATQESETQKVAFEGSLIEQDTHFRKLVEELRLDSEKEKKRLRTYLDSISNDLQRYKLEGKQRLIAEKGALQIKQDQLISEISSKEEELRKQASLTASTEEASKLHWQKRMQIEKELSALKYKHDSSILEWEERVKSLEQASISEQQILQSQLVQTREQARLEVNAAHCEADETRLALEKTIAVRDHQHRLELQQVLDSSRKEEQEKGDRIQSLTIALQQYKVESERQLAAAKEAAEAEQNELRALLSAKEKQYSEHVEITVAIENKSRVELLQRSKLEHELSSMKIKYEGQVAQWESRYNSLLKSRDNALHEAETELARTEEAARELSDKFTREAEAANTLQTERLRAKDRELDLRMQEVRSSSEKMIQEVQHKLQAVSDSYQQFQLESNNNLDAEKEAGLKKQEELRLEIQKKESELADQVSMTASQQSMAEALLGKTAELERELSILRSEYESEKAGWETRYRTLQETQASELSAASALLASTKAEAAQQIQAVTEQARKQTLALESELQAQASSQSEALQELAKLSQSKETELSQKLLALEEKLKCAETNAKEVTYTETAAALAKQNELEMQITHSLQEMEKTRELLVKEQARSKELSASRTKLEKELTSIQAKYDAEVRQWTTRYEGLQAILANERRDAADRTARKEFKARERAFKEIKASRKLRDSLRQDLKEKEAAHRSELISLQELTSRKEENLKSRLSTVTKQFEQFKKEVRNRASTLVQGDDWQQGDQQDEVSSDESFYESERVRYDLTKQLVKKNVELIRQEVELRQKDAQLLAMKSGFFDDEQKETQTKLNLSAIKDHVAKLLRREVDKTMIPYTFNHNLRP